MADRKIRFVTEQRIDAKAIRIDAGDVRDIVSVLLQPLDCRIFGPEQVILCT